VDTLGLVPGQRVLDVGCGPGRHAHALARRGIEVVGVDVSRRFVELAIDAAPAGATFVHADARDLVYDREFDAAISLCQGAFGLLGGDDAVVLQRMVSAVRPGGWVAISAISAYFAVRFLGASDTFDAECGVHHERTAVRAPEGDEAEFDLWTTCFTPRELRLLAAQVGLSVHHLWSVSPGAYRPAAPDIEHPELLLVARRVT
jgi:SAM-dependent methyltransferase